MKTSLVNKIFSSPVQYPYFDAEVLKAVEPMDLRAKVAMFEVTDSIAKKYNVSTDRIPEIILAQYQAARYAAEKMKAFGLSSLDASEKSGIDVTALSKYLNGKRPFSPNAACLTPFCYNVMHESCHKVMFGEEGKILLPSPYTQTAKAMLNMSDEIRQRLLRKAKLQYAVFSQQNPTEIQNAPKRPQSAIISERIYELIYDNGFPGYQFFGPETPYQIRNLLKQFLLEDYQKATPRIGFLMYLSFETGLALDYFISEDFTRYTHCYFKNGDTTLEIQNRDVLNYIGICSAMPSNQRQILMGEAVGTNLGKYF